MPTTPPAIPSTFAPAQNTVAIGGVTCTIGHDDRDGWRIEESQPVDGPDVWAEYICDWARRYDLVKGLLGSSTYVGGKIVRTPPHAYPLSDNLYALEIGRIRWIKSRWANGYAAADRVVIPVRYGVPKWGFFESDPVGQADPSGQPWTTTTIQVANEVTKVPNGAYYFIDDIAVPTSAGTTETRSKMVVPESSSEVSIPIVNITMRRHWCPWIDLRLIVLCSGSTNLLPVTFSNYTFERGQLLLCGVETEESTDSLGNKTHEIVYTMCGRTGAQIDDAPITYPPSFPSVDPITWNHVIAPDGAWRQISSDGTDSGRRPYPQIDWYTYLP